MVLIHPFLASFEGDSKLLLHEQLKKVLYSRPSKPLPAKDKVEKEKAVLAFAMGATAMG